MKGGRLEVNRYYKISILYLVFMDSLKVLCKPELVRPDTCESHRAILNTCKEF